MIEFNKPFNLKIIVLVIAGLFLVTSTGYGKDLSDSSYLRNPLMGSNSGGEKRLRTLFNEGKIEQGIAAVQDARIQLKRVLEDIGLPFTEFTEFHLTLYLLDMFLQIPSGIKNEYLLLSLPERIVESHFPLIFEEDYLQDPMRYFVKHGKIQRTRKAPYGRTIFAGEGEAIVGNALVSTGALFVFDCVAVVIYDLDTDANAVIHYSTVRESMGDSLDISCRWTEEKMAILGASDNRNFNIAILGGMDALSLGVSTSDVPIVRSFSGPVNVKKVTDYFEKMNIVYVDTGGYFKWDLLRKKGELYVRKFNIMTKEVTFEVVDLHSGNILYRLSSIEERPDTIFGADSTIDREKRLRGTIESCP